MKKLLLSTFIFFGLFSAAINAEALTDTERLQMLQKHAGDIAFVDDTTLEDVAWLTKGLDEEGLKWLTEYLKNQTNPSGVDVLEALVGAQNPDRDTRLYIRALRGIKNTPCKLAEKQFDVFDHYFNPNNGLLSNKKPRYIRYPAFAVAMPTFVILSFELLFTNSSYLISSKQERLITQVACLLFAANLAIIALH